MTCGPHIAGMDGVALFSLNKICGAGQGKSKDRQGEAGQRSKKKVILSTSERQKNLCKWRFKLRTLKKGNSSMGPVSVLPLQCLVLTSLSMGRGWAWMEGQCRLFSPREGRPTLLYCPSVVCLLFLFSAVENEEAWFLHNTVNWVSGEKIKPTFAKQPWQTQLK